MKTTLEAFRFFQAHAGGWVGHNAESALRLARAEARAKAVGLVFEWVDDDEPAESCTGRKIRERGKWVDEYKQYPAVGCIVYPAEAARLGTRSQQLAALWGIIESENWREQRDYRRVVEAELALEAFSTHHSAAWAGL